jgi:DNA-binding transcriptional LysR family regulator
MTMKNGRNCSSQATLRLLVDETFGELVLKPQLSAFLVAHPSLSVELLERSWKPGKLPTAVDLAFQHVSTRSLPARASSIGKQRLLTCAAPRYLREYGLPEHPRDLHGSRHKCIVVSDSFASAARLRFRTGARNLNVDISRRTTVPSVSTAFALTLAGAGVSQMPEIWSLNHIRSGALVRLLPDWEAILQLIALEPLSGANSAAAVFLRFARAIVEMGVRDRPY